MPTETSEAATKGENREDDIAGYLRDHPEFFERRRDLLLTLKLPGSGTDQVIPLIERQVQVLRDECNSVRQQLAALLAQAVENEQREAKLHAFAMALLSQDSLAALLSDAPDRVGALFDIPWVRIRLGHVSHPEAAASACASDDPSYRALCTRIEHGGSVCDGRLDAAQAQFLFGESGLQIRSCALVPLAADRKAIIGVMGLGAADAQRFAPDLGTMYLDRVGQLLGAALARWFGADAGARGADP